MTSSVKLSIPVTEKGTPTSDGGTDDSKVVRAGRWIGIFYSRKETLCYSTCGDHSSQPVSKPSWGISCWDLRTTLLSDTYTERSS